MTVRLKAFAAGLARETTDFWIDQPEISLEQVSGLDSIIQGNSIQARIGGGSPATRFEGLSKPPLTPLEAPSLVLKLQARNIPFLARGAPVYYHGVTVGAVKQKTLDTDGLPYLYVVVDEDFAPTVRSNARFWCVSATSVQAGPGGLKLNVAGLAALLQGGVEFDVFGTPGDRVKDGAEFELFADERAARLSAPPIRISFDNGQGLLAGQTQLRYLGMPIGLVEEARPDPSSGKVEVVARLEPGYDILRRAGTVFSLVRPRISLEGVSGLETLVSGVYIECVPGPAGEPAERFLGRTVTDTEWTNAQAENQGISIVLRAKEIPAIGKGAPVLYRGIVVGKVKDKDMGGQNVPFLRVVIRKEFAQAVRRNGKFWRLPATSVQAGPGVLKVDVAGLDTLFREEWSLMFLRSRARRPRTDRSSSCLPTNARLDAVRRRFAFPSKTAMACSPAKRNCVTSECRSDWWKRLFPRRERWRSWPALSPATTFCNVKAQSSRWSALEFLWKACPVWRHW